MFAFVFTGEALEPINTTSRVSVEARGLYKEVIDRVTKQPRRILDDINFIIEPVEFVVIFGTNGKVLYNGTDLYASFD